VEVVGDVSLKLVNGFVLVLKDVLFVPSLQRNLISVPRLDTDGFGCHFVNGKCELRFDNISIGESHLELHLPHICSFNHSRSKTEDLSREKLVCIHSW